MCAADGNGLKRRRRAAEATASSATCTTSTSWRTARPSARTGARSRVLAHFLEGVAHLVSQLSSDQRSELIDLLRTMAEAESDPARREFLEGFPEGFELVDDVV
ncbi:hypothetical protein [Streptomyces sp. NPDC055400]